MKFKSFVKEQMFFKREAKDYLCWVFVDRAEDCYTLMLREDRHIPLRQLLKRMEQRFTSKHLRETALIRFQNAKLRIEESIEERLHHLALYAFEEVSEAGVWKRDIKQMMLKFCTGFADREAGLHAENMRPESLGEPTTYISSTNLIMLLYMVEGRIDRLKRQSTLSALDDITGQSQGVRNKGGKTNETGGISWDNRSCPADHPKDSSPLEVLNPNGLDPPYQPQRVVDPNGLDPSHQPLKLVNPNGLGPPHQLQKVVNPNGLNPPDKLKHKEKLELALSEEDTGLQHQEVGNIPLSVLEYGKSKAKKLFPLTLSRERSEMYLEMQ
ncbi:hypothetical protein PoB_006567700 [Plakobranchus ocellatus]|uniref:Uncharacterized protein n=1 Tax=Plakobranchus ocellatus TaxID=259542 RepID=A0AAV4D4U7_9GAST|nr:hypothetical protein PoB_006567700 [Plakobranchus ocellatus]